MSEVNNAAVALAAVPEIAEVFTGAAGPGSMAAGTIHTQCHSRHDREVPEVDLLSPLTVRGVTFRNRIAMSPLCMYSSKDGFATDFHLVHLGSRAIGGAALVMVEASAVTARGAFPPLTWESGKTNISARYPGSLDSWKRKAPFPASSLPMPGARRVAIRHGTAEAA